MQEFNTILLRYGELFLKGNNKNQFESVLIKNIKSALQGLDFKFERSQGRYSVENLPADDFDEALLRLRRVFGLHSLSPCVKVKTDMAQIGLVAVQMVPKSGSFRVTANRADKRVNMRSMDIARDIGGKILESNPNLTVDLFNFDFELNIDIRENGYTYLFCQKILCEGGLPVGTSGKAALMLSGGIDSPVAAYHMAKRGLRIFAVHFHSYPYTGELALQKVKDISKQLAKFTLPIRLAVVPFTEVQLAIHDNCREDYMITIMRRIMLRITEGLAKREGASTIITGESLGQVASQTIESITVTNSVAGLPILRPLIGMDKSEIIETAKHIDTFDISIRPYEDCCTVFMPKFPVIRPTIKEAELQETALDIDALVKNAIEKTEVIVME